MKELPTIPAEDTMPTLDENARKLVDCALVGARDCFDRDGEALGVILVLPEQGEPQVYPATHSNDEEKRKCWDFLREQKANNPHVVLISEVWMSRCGKDGINPDGSAKVRPMNDPNRFEQVMVTLYSGPRTVMFCAEITRNPDKLGEWVTFYDSAFPLKGGADSMGGALMDGQKYAGNAN